MGDTSIAELSKAIVQPMSPLEAQEAKTPHTVTIHVRKCSSGVSKRCCESPGGEASICTHEFHDGFSGEMQWENQ